MENLPGINRWVKLERRVSRLWLCALEHWELWVTAADKDWASVSAVSACQSLALCRKQTSIHVHCQCSDSALALSHLLYGGSCALRRNVPHTSCSLREKEEIWRTVWCLCQFLQLENPSPGKRGRRWGGRRPGMILISSDTCQSSRNRPQNSLKGPVRVCFDHRDSQCFNRCRLIDKSSKAHHVRKNDMQM